MNSRVTQARGTSVGFDAQAANFATAVGNASRATILRATAVGSTANASRIDSTALGSASVAAFDRSTAVGFGATTTRVDQVTLGGAGSSVRVADIAASNAVQVGAEQVVTIDSAGTLGTSEVASAASVANVRVSVDYLAAVTDAQFSALSGRVGNLESSLAATNFRIEDVNQRLSGGIAATAALGSAIALPDQSFTVGGNVATYNGEQGYAATITGRVSENFAVGAGIAGNTGDGEIVAQAGFAFGF